MLSILGGHPPRQRPRMFIVPIEQSLGVKYWGGKIRDGGLVFGHVRKDTTPSASRAQALGADLPHAKQDVRQIGNQVRQVGA